MATTPKLGWPYPDRGTSSNSWLAALALRLDGLVKAAPPKLNRTTIRDVCCTTYFDIIIEPLDARRDTSRGWAHDTGGARAGYTARVLEKGTSTVLPAGTYTNTSYQGRAAIALNIPTSKARTTYQITVTTLGDGVNYSDSDPTPIFEYTTP